MAAVLCFLLAPIVAITAGSLTTTSFVTFPPQGLTLRWYWEALGRSEYMGALGRSLLIATAAATLATLLGTACAYALQRYRVAANAVLRATVLTPVMLPAILLGLAFLIAYSSMGIGGSMVGLLAAHVVSTVPFAVSLVMVGLQNVDPVIERAARNLGATPWSVFRLITLPLISWSVATGWGFAFMISFGTLELSLFLATPSTITLPVAIYTALEWSPLNPMLTALASGVVLVTFAVLVILAQVVDPDRRLDRR